MTEPPDIAAGLRSWTEARKNAAPNQPDHQTAKWLQYVALEPQIQAALSEGYSRRQLWMYLTEKKFLDCRYETFCRYLRTDLTQARRDAETPTEPAPGRPAPKAPEGTATPPTDRKTQPRRIPEKQEKGFKFNPVPDPRLFEISPEFDTDEKE